MTRKKNSTKESGDKPLMAAAKTIGKAAGKIASLVEAAATTFVSNGRSAPAKPSSKKKSPKLANRTRKRAAAARPKRVVRKRVSTKR
jgi:hypothetical protein